MNATSSSSPRPIRLKSPGACLVEGCRSKTKNHRHCTHPDCLKLRQGPTGLCFEHGGDDPNKRCSTPDCTIYAQGSSGLCLGHNPAFPNSHPFGTPEYAAQMAISQRKLALGRMVMDRDFPELSEFGGHAWNEPHWGYGVGFPDLGLCKLGHGNRDRVDDHRGHVSFLVTGGRLTVLQWEHAALSMSAQVVYDKTYGKMLCPVKGYTEIRRSADLAPAFHRAILAGLEVDLIDVSFASSLSFLLTA